MASRKRRAAPDSAPEQDRESAAPSPEPVRKIRIAGEPKVRAGGYVLTERGWVRES